MLLSLLALIGHGTLADSTPLEPWCVAPNMGHFVELTDDKVGEIAYSDSEGQHVIVLNTAGKAVRKINVPKGKNALGVGKGGTLTVVPNAIVEFTSAAQNKPTRSPDDPTFFAQYSSLFLWTKSVQLITGPAQFEFERFDSFSGIAINREGTKIVTMKHDWMTGQKPVATVFSLEKSSSGDWHWDMTQSFEPLVPGLGACSIIPLCNELRFVSKDAVVFVGKIIKGDGPTFQDSLAQALKSVPTAIKGRIPDGKAGGTAAFVFNMGLATKSTKPIGVVRVSAAGLGTGVVKNILAGTSGKWFYVRAGKYIYRFDIKQ